MPIIAYKMVADYQFSASPITRTNLRAVTLLAMVTWLTNSLHATPDTGPSSRQLLLVTLPLVRREDIDDRSMPFRISKPNRVYGLEPDEGFEDGNRMTPAEAIGGGGAFRASPAPGRYPFNEGPGGNRNDDLVPAYLRGYMFLRGISYDEGHEVPMMGGGQGYLSESTFKYMYGSDFTSFRDFVYRGELFTKANPTRTRNRVRQLVYVPPPGTEIANVFDLPNGNLTIPDIDYGRQMGGGDSGDDSGSDSDDETKITRNKFMSKLYRQIFIDLIGTAPNPKPRGEGGYCYIAKGDSDEVTEAIFKDRNVGKYFKASRMKTATQVEWDLAYDHLLPPPGAPPKIAKAQNFPKCAFYTALWPHYITHVPRADVITARKHLKKKFDKLAWIPWVKSDRIWETSSKRNNDMTRSPGVDKKNPAPHILCRGPFSWDTSVRWVSKKDAAQVRVT